MMSINVELYRNLLYLLWGWFTLSLASRLGLWDALCSLDCPLLLKCSECTSGIDRLAESFCHVCREHRLVLVSVGIWADSIICSTGSSHDCYQHISLLSVCCCWSSSSWWWDVSQYQEKRGERWCQASNVLFIFILDKLIFKYYLGYFSLNRDVSKHVLRIKGSSFSSPSNNDNGT